MDQNNEPPRIVFESEEFQRPRQSFRTSMPKMVGWVIRYSGGAIKDEKQANYALVGFVMVVIFISLLLFFAARSERPSGPPTPFQEGKNL